MNAQTSAKKQKVPGTAVKKDNRPKGQFGDILGPDVGSCLGPKKDTAPIVTKGGYYSENADSCVIP